MGLDVHQATADKMDVSRDEAKTLNFMLLYGGGNDKLAADLDIDVAKATRLRKDYFSAMPQVKEFINGVIYTAEKRGFIVNWLGRRCHFTNPDFAYKAPNYLIQGGCADVAKIAMVRCNKLLKPMRSKLIKVIHDELVFKVHRTELDVVPELHKIMETAYPHKHIPLTAGVDHSWTNWYDKVEGFPSC